jgi:hypothetical protein
MYPIHSGMFMMFTLFTSFDRRMASVSDDTPPPIGCLGRWFSGVKMSCRKIVIN